LPASCHISSDALRVSINDHGAEICSIKNKAGTEFIWQADKQVWARHAPVLFPIVGRLKNNQFIFEEKTYDMGQHGFARDQVFELKESDATSCTFELRSTAASKRTFPFEFIFRISYRLDGNTLITNYTVTNPSQEALLFSVGAHPAFIYPLSKNEKQEDHYIEFEAEQLEITELANGLLTDKKQQLKLANKRLFLSPKIFENDALVFENGQIATVTLGSVSSDHKITMRCEGWPYFGIWSKPGQNFVCLEPWYGIADAEHSNQQLTDKKGIMKLGAGEEFCCEFLLEII